MGFPCGSAGKESACNAIAASAAKSLQSFLTLCNPIDGSPPGSPIPGILQARTLEWVAISFSNALKWKVKVKSFKSCPTPSDPMDCSLPGSSVHGIFQARVLEWVAIAFSGNAVDLVSIPGLGRSPGEGKGYPSSSLAWRIPYCVFHGIAESQTWLSDFHSFTHIFMVSQLWF